MKPLPAPIKVTELTQIQLTSGGDFEYLANCSSQFVTNVEVVGLWEQIFYGEFDGRRRKRVLVKIIGE